eukprot:2591872-Ditylum_brightwellii.AAC.1
MKWHFFLCSPFTCCCTCRSIEQNGINASAIATAADVDATATAGGSPLTSMFGGGVALPDLLHALNLFFLMHHMKNDALKPYGLMKNAVLHYSTMWRQKQVALKPATDSQTAKVNMLPK